MGTMHLVLHVEQTDDPAAPFVWWGEIPELPGFYGAADTLVSLRAQVHAALDDLGHDVAKIVEQLAPADDATAPERSRPADQIVTVSPPPPGEHQEAPTLAAATA